MRLRARFLVEDAGEKGSLSCFSSRVAPMVGKNSVCIMRSPIFFRGKLGLRAGGA